MPDRQVLRTYDAVGASSWLTTVDERPLVPSGDDSIFQAFRAGWVVVVHGAVVELAEADGQPCASQQVVFNADVTAPSLAGDPEGLSHFADCSEGLAHLVSPRSVADDLAPTVCVEEVLEPLEASFGNRGIEMAGPGRGVIHVALGV